MPASADCRAGWLRARSRAILRLRAIILRFTQRRTRTRTDRLTVAGRTPRARLRRAMRSAARLHVRRALIRALR